MESTSSVVALILILILASLFYLRGWRRTFSFSMGVTPVWRAVSFLLGMFLIWLALGSPLSTYDHDLLTAHMIQHLLLMTFAPALILLGEPVLAVWHGLPRVARDALGRLFQSRWMQRLAHALSRLTLCWTVSAFTLVAWHIPSVFTAALHSSALHAFEQASFFGAGFLFWWPVIEPWPSSKASSRWPILLYLFLATLPCDILSGFLVFSERIAYPVYFSAPRHFGLSGLADQECAGALMWTVVTVVYLVPAAIITTRLLSPRRSHRVEQEVTTLR